MAHIFRIYTCAAYSSFPPSPPRLPPPPAPLLRSFISIPLTFWWEEMGQGDRGRGSALRGLTSQWGWPKVSLARQFVPVVLWMDELVKKSSPASGWTINDFYKITPRSVFLLYQEPGHVCGNIILFYFNLSASKSRHTTWPPLPLIQSVKEKMKADSGPVMSIPPSYKVTSQTVKNMLPILLQRLNNACRERKKRKKKKK